MAADRTVKVKLIGTADTRDYDRGVEKMIAETKVAEKAIGNLDERATPALTDLGKSADKAGLQLHDAGGEVAVFAAKARDVQAAAGKAEDSVEALGQKAKTTGGDIHFLDAEIARLKLHMRDLALEIDRTGNVDLFKDIKSDKGELARLVQVRKLLTPDPKMLSGLFDGLVKNLDFKTAGIAIAAPLAATLVPVLGAAIAGAVAGGVGLIGVAGGIALAAKSEAVRTAAADLGHTVADDMFRAGKVFDAPVVAALGRIKQAWSGGIGADVAHDLELASGAVDDLADGLVGLVQGILPGFTAALESGAVETLAAELPDLGAAVGELLTDLSESKGVITGLKATFDFLDSAIVVTGKSIAILSDIFQWATDQAHALDENLGPLLDDLQSMTMQIPGLNKGIELFGHLVDLAAFTTGDWLGQNHALGVSLSDVASDAADVADAADGDAAAAVRAAAGMAKWRDELNKMTDLNISAEQANIKLEQSIDDATDAWQENGKGIDANNPKQRDNRDALLGIADAANTAYDKILAQTGSQELASAATDRGRTAFLKAASAMGVGAVQAGRLADQLFRIPSAKTINFSTFNFKSVLDSVNNLKMRIAEIKTRIDITAVMTTSYGGGAHTGQGYSTGQRWGGVTEHADIGLLRDAQAFRSGSQPLYAFAEPATKGEAFIPKNGDYGRSMGILGKAAGWYGADVVPKAWRGGGPQTVHHEHVVTLQWPDGKVIRRFSIDDAVGRGVPQSLIGAAYP